MKAIHLLAGLIPPLAGAVRPPGLSLPLVLSLASIASLPPARGADVEGCDGWAEAGECAANPRYMLTHCSEACVGRGAGGGEVPGAAPRPSGGPAAELAEVAEDEDGCDGWADAGECADNPKYMLSHCPNACARRARAGTDAPEEVEESDRDAVADCEGWAREGECSKNLRYMIEHCPKACKRQALRILFAAPAKIPGMEDDDGGSGAGGDAAKRELAHPERKLVTPPKANAGGILSSIKSLVAGGEADDEDDDEESGPSFFDLEAEDIEGEVMKFEQFRGKVTVIINVASYCGYTETHYWGLVQLNNRFRGAKAGFNILAFPCNQFGAQEPKTCPEIKKFAESKGVEFTMMNKVHVNGADAHPVYKFLKKAAGPAKIEWNFATYYVVGPGGSVTSRSNVEPMDLVPEILDAMPELSGEL